jgi:hypothetical protein
MGQRRVHCPEKVGGQPRPAATSDAPAVSRLAGNDLRGGRESCLCAVSLAQTATIAEATENARHDAIRPLAPACGSDRVA